MNTATVVQNFIDRRFYRQKYNTEQILESFSTVTHDEVNLDQLTAELLRAVDSTLQPEHVALWLRNPHN